nr:MAG TPA: hypothetical protein [Caudoviricetes sp.]
MAEAKLNFIEEDLDKESSLYILYKRLYQGMVSANEVDSPDFSDPPLTEDGEIDTEAINETMKEYATILMKNSAYMWSDSIVSVLGEGIGGGGSTTDKFDALFGFKAGYDGRAIFETTHYDSQPVAYIYGRLDISKEGISLKDRGIIYHADEMLNFSYDKMNFIGDIYANGDLYFDSLKINKDGIFFDDKEFYHSGNSNTKDFDWSMKNASIYGNMTVEGKVILKDELNALNGFKLGVKGEKLLYSNITEDEEISILLASDLSLLAGYGIRVGDTYVIKARNGTNDIISFCAPGKTINLGDSVNDAATLAIALQTGIKNHNSAYTIISKDGDGYFPNSFRAGCGNAAPDVLWTYYKSGSDCGFIALKKIRLGDANGPALYADDVNQRAVLMMPYIHIEGELPVSEYIESKIYYAQTTSLFKDQSQSWSASLNFDTGAEFFTFNKPVESDGFSIISERYKTRLIENALFFDDNIFLEGITDGIRYSGNSYFSGTLSSFNFSSGFLGHGWLIGEDRLYGGIQAVFDSITVRKKMRVYEMEVQKSYTTNGALWVSDSCSGDLVEEIA